MSLQFQSLPLVLLFSTFVSSITSQPYRFIKPSRSSFNHRQSYSYSPTVAPSAPPSPQEIIELIPPLSTEYFTPQCAHSLLRHSFGDTMGKPPISLPYKLPEQLNCPSPPWANVVLQMDVDCRGEQYDRIAAVWLGGVEILRTSTAEPNESGIFWKVRKDVTRYSSLFMKDNLEVSMMLENIINDVFTGVYHVNLTLLFYKDGLKKSEFESGTQNLGSPDSIACNRINSGKGFENSMNMYAKPADLIIPVADDGQQGFWFRMDKESNIRHKTIDIPQNARRIVLELYVSFHGNDEFWYSNPPDVYIESNNLTTGRGNGAYREVFVKIDGSLVASEIPFPVIFAGGINPLFWGPIVSIGAFDLPSYDFDLTPFMALLVGGKRSHRFELGVLNAIDFWLVNANVHVWLDRGSDEVQAKLASHKPPMFREVWKWRFKELDGLAHVKAKWTSESIGWVVTSCGNLTTTVSKMMKFTNVIKFANNGADKTVTQKVKAKTQVKVESDSGVKVSHGRLRSTYPLFISTSTLPGPDPGTELMVTNVSHSLTEEFSNGNIHTSLYSSQDSGGWIAIKDHDVLSGTATTQQNISRQDQFGCYSRTAEATNGELVKDDWTRICQSLIYRMPDELLLQSF